MNGHDENFGVMLLQEFYKAYAIWLRAGAPDGSTYSFCQSVGLCTNLNNFLSLTGALGRSDASHELHLAFVAAGLDSDYPFNEGEEDYESERGHHLNWKRRQWVFDHEGL